MGVDQNYVEDLLEKHEEIKNDHVNNQKQVKVQNQSENSINGQFLSEGVNKDQYLPVDPNKAQDMQDKLTEEDHKELENQLEKAAKVNNDQINNEVQAQIQKQSANQIPEQIIPAQANKDPSHQGDDHMDVDPHNIKD